MHKRVRTILAVLVLAAALALASRPAVLPGVMWNSGPSVQAPRR